MNVIIKPFTTPKGNYVYDRETNSILTISREDYESFLNIFNKNENSKDIAILQKYQEKGYFKERILKKIYHPQEKYLDFHLDNRIEKITLQVTQNCNLRCKYCTYSGLYNQRPHANKKMSFEIMKKSVDFAMSRSLSVEKVDIGFYGGEPLLEINNIKKIIDYINGKYTGRSLSYSLTTNGTVFTEDNINFLKDHNFNVMISLDGPKELHNVNRVFSNGEGSFDKIMENLNYIKSKYPDYFKNISFNTVVAPNNDYQCVNDFFNINDIFEDNRLQKATLSEYNLREDVSYDDKYFFTYKSQHVKILLSAIGLYNKKKISKLFTADFQRIIRFYDALGKNYRIPEISHPGGPCIPGCRRPFIDIDGNIFPCERVSEQSSNMNIGNIFTGFYKEKITKILSIGQITQNECINCWNFLNCGLCASSADNTTDFSYELRLSHCRSTKFSTLSIMKSICLLKEYNYNFRGDYYND